MAVDLDNIQKTYPFLSLISVANNEYVGIIQNSDNRKMFLNLKMIIKNLNKSFMFLIY